MGGHVSRKTMYSGLFLDDLFFLWRMKEILQLLKSHNFYKINPNELSFFF